jgi:hypothetical protein
VCACREVIGYAPLISRALILWGWISFHSISCLITEPQTHNVVVTDRGEHTHTVRDRRERAQRARGSEKPISVKLSAQLVPHALSSGKSTGRSRSVSRVMANQNESRSKRVLAFQYMACMADV